MFACCPQVLEARIDHTRVVQIISRADHLPLVKDYLLAVQKVRPPVSGPSSPAMLDYCCIILLSALCRLQQCVIISVRQLALSHPSQGSHAGLGFKHPSHQDDARSKDQHQHQPADALCPQANLPAVNEAVNNLLIEEEDFTSLRESISTYDAFDQIGLASRLESHELLEFRRTAAAIYKNNQRWRKAIALAKQDHLYKVRGVQNLLAVSCETGGLTSHPSSQA